MSAPAEAVDTLRGMGFSLVLESPPPTNTDDPRPALRLRLEGPEAPPEDLRREVLEHRDEVKAALLLSDPPDWLAKLFDLYWSGHETPVKRSSASGGAEVYMVSVSMKNIAAAVAAEVGMPVLEWERILPEVEEALGTWEGAA